MLSDRSIKIVGVLLFTTSLVIINSTIDEDLKAGSALTLWGVFFYYFSFARNKLLRKFRDIPRSKIESAAMGTNVKVAGKVLNMAENGVISPLSGVQGAAFMWILEQDNLSGPDTIWEHSYTFYSTPYLYIRDEEEHIAAIDLSVCEFEENLFLHKVQFNTARYDIPEKVKDIFDKTSMLKTSTAKSFFSSNDYRIKEKVFTYEEPIYALGAAFPPPGEEVPMTLDRKKKVGKHETRFERKLADLFIKEKSNKETISKYDSNNNLVLDKTEEALLMKDVEAEILAIHGISPINEYLKKAKLLLTIDHSATGSFKLNKVYLSTKSEENVQSNLLFHVRLGLVLGLIMVVAGITIIFNDLL